MLGVVVIFPAMLLKSVPPPFGSMVCMRVRMLSLATSDLKERSVSAAKDESRPSEIPIEMRTATAFFKRAEKVLKRFIAVLLSKILYRNAFVVSEHGLIIYYVNKILTLIQNQNEKR